MSTWFAQLRHHIDAAPLLARRRRTSSFRATVDLILGMTVVMLLVVLLARALTHFFAAT
jgi:hypothetical protein